MLRCGSLKPPFAAAAKTEGVQSSGGRTELPLQVSCSKSACDFGPIIVPDGGYQHLGRPGDEGMEAQVRLYCKPTSIVSDNGAEFTSRAILKWANENGVDWRYIDPGIGRSTRPVISAMGISSLSYLMTWGPLVTFCGVNNMPWLPLLATASSACLVTLAAPAFALAVGIEGYFMRRLRALETVAP